MRREAGANLGLPSLTVFLASDAKTLGGFGLVTAGITILYHASDLGLDLPCATFTKYYRRDQRTHN